MLVLSGAVVTSCSGGEEKQTGTEAELSLGTAKQAIEAQAQSLTTTIRLPAAVPLESAVVSSAGVLRLGDRARIGGQATAVSELELGHDAQSGSLTSGGLVRLRDRSRVSGDVTAGGSVERGNSVTVSGSVRANQVVPFVERSWTVSVPETNGGNVHLEPDTSAQIGPGAYADVTVKSRATLRLSSGVYVLRGLQVEPQGVLSIDDRDGPVQLYVTTGFTFRGVVRSATVGVPQLLIAYHGTQTTFVEAPFTGVLIAPRADLRLQAARPEGHRAWFHAKNLFLEPDMRVRPIPFDWPVVVGPGANPGVPPGTPVHDMPGESPGDVTVSVNGDGTGTTTATGSSDTPIDFKLPESYPVEGGVIGNGTVTFTFTPPGGGSVTCTYRGQSPTASPTTPLDLNLGRLLQFVSCTDGLPHDAPRRGVDFELEVTPAPGYPVTITSPIIEDDSCADRMELISAAETYNLRTSFNWNAQSRVAGTDANGRPTLFYAWIYIRDKKEALALKQLYIHVLHRPLFANELDQFAGRCGSFSNPGDGSGAFVPVLIPGRTYNRLIDALTSSDVQGDRVIFDAVILREVPAAARTSVGSVDLQLLANAGFRYLDYEPDALRPFDQFELDSGASKALTDALEWVAETGRNVGQFITNTLGELDQLFRGEVNVTLHMHAVTRDPEFGGNSLMVRGWGSGANTPLPAIGAEVTILQKLFDSPIPTTAQGRTDSTGRVTIDATEDADARGNGICYEMRTPGAMITDFLIANMVCDLRQWDPTDTGPGDTEVFRLRDFSRNQTVELRIGNTEVVGLHQADDMYRWSRERLGFNPKRARILTGYWANTFAPDRQDGQKRLFAPCLNFRNSLSDAALVAGATGGFLAQLIVPVPVLPALTGAFTSILFNSDIVMSTESNLRTSRLVMSHEYGHYLFCALLQDENGSSVDHVIWSTIAAGDALDVPIRYTNEAMADFFAGQVAGGADYEWINDARRDFCIPPTGPEPVCWEENQNGSPANGDDPAGIGRTATLLLDVFDGHGAPRGAPFPIDGDVWTFSDPGNRNSPLTFSPTGYLNQDSHLERVALPAQAMRTFTDELADGLGLFGTGDSIDDAKVYGGLDQTMRDNAVSWCDRCRVLGLHAPNAGLGNTPTVRQLFEACVNDPLVADAVGPPVDAFGNPIDFLRFDAASCTECPAGTTSDQDGVCQPCPNVVQGNTCTTCTADVLLDGATMTLGEHVFTANGSAPGDTCPDVFVVQVNNPAALFGREVLDLRGSLAPQPLNEALCERPYELTVSVDGVQDSVLTGTGVFSTCPPGTPICISFCNETPTRVFGPGELTNGSVQFATPVDGSTRMTVFARLPIEPPG